MSFRTGFLCFVMAVLVASPVWAEPQTYTIGISEGTSGGIDHGQGVIKYQGMADVLARALKGKVNVVFSRSFEQLESGMKSGLLDFVMARPSDYPARGMRDHGYSFVSSAKPEGHCVLLVEKDSALRSLADIKGKKIVFPESISYMSRFCTAQLRDQGIDVKKENVQFVREQAAVGYFLANHLVEVGAVASYSAVAKNAEKDGRRILHKSVPQPYFPLVAHRRITPDQIKAVRLELTSLPGQDAGKAMLKMIDIDQFDTGSESRMQALLPWLGL